MQDQAWQAEQFEQHRPQLTAVAYRILGSAAEAEDAVQEAWLRLSKSGGETIANYGGWLTTVTGRVCLDMLRSRRSRREFYLGSWEPEVAGDGPEQETVLADSVGWALMVVLDALNPAERVAFVLHDLFAVPFEEIAPLVGRSPAATRQLASGIQQSDRRTPVAGAGQAHRSPGRGQAHADGRLPVRSAVPACPGQRRSRGRRGGPGGPLAVARLTISGDRIAAIELILDPAVLRAFTVAGGGSPA